MSYKVKNRVNIIKYAILFFLVLLYTLIFLTTIGWLLLSVMLFTFLLAFISLKLGNLNNLEMTIDHFLVANNEEEIQFECVVQKKTARFVFFPILKIDIKELGISERIYCYTGKQRILTMTYRPTERGHFKQMKASVESSDTFFFFYNEKIKKQPIDWYILPKYVVDTSKILTNLESLWSNTLFGEPTYDIKGYRTYVHGDSMKQIDWKQTSKHQEMMVKELAHENESFPSFLLLPFSSDYFEDTLSFFYSLFVDLAETSASFYCLNHHGQMTQIEDVLEFARIQPFSPLKDLSLLKDIEQEMYVFVPELETVNKEVTTNSVQLMTYKKLKESGYEHD